MPERNQADIVRGQLREQRIDLRRRKSEHELHTLVREATCKQFAAGDCTHRILLSAFVLCVIDVPTDISQVDATPTCLGRRCPLPETRASVFSLSRWKSFPV